MVNTNNIFYHLFSVDNSIEKFDRTYKKIEKSGLIDDIDKIYVNCVGVLKNDFGTVLSGYNKVVVSYGNYDRSEEDTLNLLRTFCINNQTGNSLYLHSKGILHKNNQNVQDWIDCMEYFLIEEHKLCLSYLETHDTCGINIQDKPSSHYSGNFWWAKNHYVSKLNVCNTKAGKRHPNGRWAAELNFLKPHNGKYIELYSYYKVPENNPYYISHHRKLYTNRDPIT